MVSAEVGAGKQLLKRIQEVEFTLDLFGEFSSDVSYSDARATVAVSIGHHEKLNLAHVSMLQLLSPFNSLRTGFF
jgi:hypothetical protein